jgi:hypothetical protein
MIEDGKVSGSTSRQAGRFYTAPSAHSVGELFVLETSIPLSKGVNRWAFKIRNRTKRCSVRNKAKSSDSYSSHPHVPSIQGNRPCKRQSWMSKSRTTSKSLTVFSYMNREECSPGSLPAFAIVSHWSHPAGEVVDRTNLEKSRQLKYWTGSRN